MAVEKFKGRFTNEANGCTTLINSTIQGITDITVLGLYTYLCSKPDSWEPNHKELMSHFGLTKTTTYKYLNKLLDLGLMTKKEIREKGRFFSMHYFVHLHPQLPFPKKWETAEVHEKTGDEPFPKKWDPVPPETVIPNSYKTKIYIQNKEGKYTSSTSYFTDLEKEDLLRFRIQCNSLLELEEEEVVEVFELHCKENETAKGWVKPQCIRGIKTLLKQNQFYLKPGYQSQKQKEVKAQEDIAAQKEFELRQERAHQARMEEYKKPKKTIEKRNAPSRLADLLKQKTQGA